MPLPHKRDTLGIFQFPSGETSDSAFYQTSLNSALLPNPVLNIPWQGEARGSEPPSMEYSSSFFDDYDEQDDCDDLESDDDFDESTLWEISSLLYSKDITSKGTMLPPLRQTGESFGLYVDESCLESGSGVEDTWQADVHDPSFQLPIQPLALKHKSDSGLWTRNLSSNPNVQIIGLPQPDSRIWEVYVSNSKNGVRPKPRPFEALPHLTTSALWTYSPLEKSNPTITSLWKQTKNAKDIPSVPLKNLVAPSTFLWTPQAKKAGPHIFDLVSTNVNSLHIQNSNHTIERMLEHTLAQGTEKCDHESSTIEEPKMWAPAEKSEAISVTALCPRLVTRSDYHQPDLLPALVNTARKVPVTQASLERLTSSQLWSGRQVLQTVHYWISESSVWPKNPSIPSDIPSCKSPPISDNLSVISSSSKDSSRWGSLKLAETSTSLSATVSKNLTPIALADNEYYLRPRVSQPNTRSLVTTRESRVLTYRDLFESKASVLDCTSAKKQRRSTLCPDPPKTVQKLVRNEHRSSFAFPENWSDAFAEAEVASTPKSSLARLAATKTKIDTPIFQNRSRLQRPYCTLDTWKAALNEAITLSTIPRTSPTKSHDVTTCHPVFFAAFLVSSAADIHPAAIGYVDKPAPTGIESYDTAIHVPVAPSEFNGKAGMWINLPANAAPPTDSGLLWSKDSGIQVQNRFAHLSAETARRPTLPKSLHLPPLESSQLWQRISAERNWSSVTNTPQVQMWRATPSTPSLTWSAGSNSGIPEDYRGGLWISRTSSVVSTPSIFYNPHGEPWNKKKRNSTSATETTSTELWRLSAVLPNSPKHWLTNKRISRVDFRY